jgi:hypothetical protein
VVLSGEKGKEYHATSNLTHFCNKTLIKYISTVHSIRILLEVTRKVHRVEGLINSAALQI